jgi:tetrahydromethanopterin S-methyltransferase subunit C
VNGVEPPRLIAAAFALAGFAVAIVAGLAAQNPSPQIIQAGIIAMIVCYITGTVLASVGQRVVNEHLDRIRASAALAEAQPPGPVEGPGKNGGTVEKRT